MIGTWVLCCVGGVTLLLAADGRARLSDCRGGPPCLVIAGYWHDPTVVMGDDRIIGGSITLTMQTGAAGTYHLLTWEWKLVAIGCVTLTQIVQGGPSTWCREGFSYRRAPR